MRLEPIFEAVLENEEAVRRLLADDPTAARTRASRDHLVESIPHWLYVGDTSLHLAAAGLRVKIAKVLLKAGADIDRGDRGGATALHRAVRARSTAAVRQLLALGARTDGKLKSRGATPLHLAVQPTGASGTAGLLDEQVEIVGLLLEHGADREAVDTAGRTPLDWARNEKISTALS